MEAFHEYINEYKEQMAKGSVRKAYEGIMHYMMALRAHLETRYPDYFVSSSIYYGYMDMTYFSFAPGTLRNRKLKIAVVFVHETVRFEVWLCGSNRQIQRRYWQIFRQSNWKKYRIVPTTKGVDSIVENTLIEDPDFIDLDALTKQIENGTLRFIEDVESFLSAHQEQ